MARLKRVRDGAGDSGPRSEAIKWDKKTKQPIVVSNRPTIGAIMVVGSINGRSYSNQDFWCTTIVTEILEERDDYIRFMTENSEYEWFSNN